MNNAGNAVVGAQAQGMENNDPPGGVLRFLGMILILSSIVMLWMVVSSSRTQEAKFHTQLSQINIPGSRVTLEEDNGIITANVSLGAKWDRTALFKGMGVDGRELMVRLSYSGVESTEQGAISLVKQIDSDVESLIAGKQPQSFTGLYHTSHFTFVAIGATNPPLNLLFFTGAMMLLMLIVGRREKVIYIAGCLKGILLIMLSVMSYMTHTGKTVFFPIEAVEIIQE